MYNSVYWRGCESVFILSKPYLQTMTYCFDKEELGDMMKRKRRIMENSAAILIAIVFIIAVPASANLVPDIGGDPIYTQVNDDFSGGQTDWSLTVFSYVFDTTSPSLPGSLTLDPGEMLFMYLLNGMHTTKAVSIDYFSIGNPHLLPINCVAYENTVVPAGYDSADFQAPYTYGYAGPSHATVYNYSGDFFNPYFTLDPDEYSLVYYITVAQDYTQVPASASGGGVGDNGLVPGPIPEPATIFLLGLGALALVRKRKP